MFVCCVLSDACVWCFCMLFLYCVFGRLVSYGAVVGCVCCTVCLYGAFWSGVFFV